METVARSEFSLENGPRFNETPAGNFITDGMRLTVGEETGERVDVALQANGNIRSSIDPGTMPHSEGEVAFYEIGEATGLGYGEDGYAGNPTVSMYLTGDEIRQLLEVAVLMEQERSDIYFLQFSGVRYEYEPRNAVLFTVPFLDLPIPTGRAVTEAELYTGDGVQPAPENADPGDFVELERGDEELYHVTTDAYILSFLPEINEVVPQMDINPKTADGEVLPPEEFGKFVVHKDDGTELKVWETVVEHAASETQVGDSGMEMTEEGGVPRIPEHYADTSGRIVQEDATPFIWYVYLAVFGLVVAVSGVVFWRRRNRNGHG
jgi:hypothetical protein